MKISSFSDLLPEKNQAFDIIIVVLGPESRAVNIIKKYNISAAIKLAVICGESDQLAYSANKIFFDENGFVAISNENLLSSLKSYTNSIDRNEITIAIDISCMPRQLMAKLFVSVLELDKFENFNISFHYSLANFTAPLAETAPNEAIEPVHPAFAGWPSKQSLPTSLITGLGYEPEKAEGASEYLDPAEQWGFIPVSPVSEFLPALEENNSSLITRLAADNRTVKYELQHPSRTFGQLEMVISDLLRRSNPILLPFGPKVFFAICIVQAFRHPEVGVWHVTGETNESPVDRCASGIEIGFQVKFQKYEV